MTWFKIDDKFHSHPKVLTAGNSAVGLYVRCGSWVSDQLTDGFVPEQVARMYGTVKEIKALIDAGLWRRTVGGYTINDFLEYNPSAEEVKATRATRAEAGRAGGKRSGEARRSKAEANSEALASGLLEANREAKTNPVPSRPDPVTTSSSSSPEPAQTQAADDDDGGLIDAIIQRVAKAEAAQRSTSSGAGYMRQVAQQMQADERSAIAQFLMERPEARNDLDTAARVYAAIRMENAS